MLIPEKILYETVMTAHGGREGRAESADGTFTVSLSMPKSLGGSGGDGTNPEQLFAAGYAACFLGAVRHVARIRKVVLPEDLAIVAKVGIGPILSGYALAVELTASLGGIDRLVAEDIVAEAHECCPYSNAIRGNVDVKLSVA